MYHTLSAAERDAIRRHRIPIHGSFGYLAAIGPTSRMPSERELLQFRSFLDYLREGNPYHRDRHDFYVDGRQNTYLFILGNGFAEGFGNPQATGWRWRFPTHQHGYVPVVSDLSLVACIDRATHVLRPSWLTWKAARPELFGDAS